MANFFVVLIDIFVVLTLAVFEVSASVDAGRCLKVFDSASQTIIKSKESLEAGAKFLTAFEQVPNQKECELRCCATANCNVAVYQQIKETDCFLFDCGAVDDFKCIFSKHDNYIAMGMMTNRVDLDKTRVHEQAKHEMDLNLLKVDQSRAEGPPQKSVDNTMLLQQQQLDRRQQGVYDSAPSQREQTAASGRQRTSYMDSSIAKPQKLFFRQEQQRQEQAPSEPHYQSKCSEYQWQCHKGDQCIALYDVCDNIPQCADNTDEDVEMCRELRRRKASALRRTNAVPSLEHRHDPWNSASVASFQKSQKAKHSGKGGSSPVSSHKLAQTGHQNSKNLQGLKEAGAARTTEPPPVEHKTSKAVESNGSSNNGAADGRGTALVLLAFGLLIMGALLLFVATRLRTARRRLRRRGAKPLHNGEGELLINGLHL